MVVLHLPGTVWVVRRHFFVCLSWRLLILFMVSYFNISFYVCDDVLWKVRTNIVIQMVILHLAGTVWVVRLHFFVFLS